MADHSNALDELDKAFSTLDLVNATDMDVFMKAIMMMDEKSAQRLRGELNHVLVKHIDTDKALKKKLTDNFCGSYDISYISEIYHKMRKVKIFDHQSRIEHIVLNIIKTSNSIEQVHKMMRHYVDGLAYIHEPELTEEPSDINDRFYSECVMDIKYHKEIAYMHNCLLQILKLIAYDYKPSTSMIDSFGVRAIRHRSVMKGIAFVFTSECAVDYSEETIIMCRIPFNNMPHSIIQQMVEYFNDRTGNMNTYSFEKTIEYFKHLGIE